MCISVFSMTSIVVRRVKRHAAKKSMWSATAATTRSTANRHHITLLQRCTTTLGPPREPCGTPNRPNPSRRTYRQRGIWYVFSYTNDLCDKLQVTFLCWYVLKLQCTTIFGLNLDDHNLFRFHFRIDMYILLLK